MDARDGRFEPVAPQRKRRRRRRRRAHTAVVDDAVVSIDLFISAEEPAEEDGATAAELQEVAERLATREQSLHVERVLLKAHASRLREEFESVARDLEARREELERWQAALTGREAVLMRREHSLGRDR